MNPDDKIGVHLIPSPLLCVQVKQLMVPQRPAAAPQRVPGTWGWGWGWRLPCSPRMWGMSRSLPRSLVKLHRGLEITDGHLISERFTGPHTPGAATSAKSPGPTSRHFCSEERKINEMLRDSGRVCDVWLCCPGCDRLWPVGTRQVMDRARRRVPVRAPAPMVAAN